jgi:hypothetical protein
LFPYIQRGHDLREIAEEMQYVAWLIFVIVILLKQYVLSDICLNCFNIKKTEKGRERGMMTGLSN